MSKSIDLSHINIQNSTGFIRALHPERGCVEDQPQQLRKTGRLEYA
jgi:hypothetical protein